MTVDILLGVDGGKSKTVCLVAERSGHIIGWGRSGNSDKYYLPFEQALDSIAVCTHQALGMAGVHPSQVAGCFGLAGADWPEDFEQLQAGLERLSLVQCLVVKNDATIVLRANAPEGFGVVISAGTHLASAIRTPQGDEWHSAWFSVEGAGGITIGHKVLWAVLTAEDGRGRPTVLTQLVLQTKGLAQPLDLLRLLSQGAIDDRFKASLAPLLFMAHHRYCDPVATALLLEVAQDMSRWPLALLERYQLLQTPMPVILAGGLFKGEGKFLIEALTAFIHARAPLAQVRLAQHEPVVGALLAACDLLGQPVTQDLLNSLAASMPPAEFFNTQKEE